MISVNSKKNYKFSSRRQLLSIVKLLFSIFVIDKLAILLLFVFPLTISLIWIILISQDVFPAIPDGPTFNGSVAKWYEFTIFITGVAGIFYIAVKFSEFRRTILFRRILVGGVNKAILSLVLLLFYWTIVFFVALVKFSLLFYYSKFRQELKHIDVGFLILGFALLSLTNISVAFFIGNLSLSPVAISFLSFFLIFLFLLLSGLIVPIETFLIDWDEIRASKSRDNVPNYDHWIKVNNASKIWRGITFISPMQPSIKIISNAHSLDQDWQIKLESGLGNVSAKDFGEYYRPMIYSNYWQPIGVNLLWITSFFGLGTYLLQRNQS